MTRGLHCYAWLAAACCLATCGTVSSSNLEKIVQNAMRTGQNYETSQTGETTPEQRSCLPKDCADLFNLGQSKSGVYRVWPEGWRTCGMQVYCDLDKDGGGWTVIQRRGAFGNPQDFFYRRWRDYKYGFGNVAQDFWLGNDMISHLSNQKNYVLRINLKTKEGESRYAEFEEFYVEPESNNYRLWVHGYKGDAGDSFTQHSGMYFCTSDRDNDNDQRNCAVESKSGWWHNNCHTSNLNGLYLDGPHESSGDGINWHLWKGYHYSLSDVEMKIRPKFYRSK